ncbi:MAG: DUF4417 domain-containing protein [Eubacterium sp.]|nr:DUF4417 domain-containing protein [Eubacterium sp.]
MEKIINDGFRADWVENALFSGIMEIPVIKKQNISDLPKRLVPFTVRNRVDGNKEVVCFYEHDDKFYDFISKPDGFIGDLQKFSAVISPDCSLYIDMPLCLQIADVYVNRALGHYLQEKGFLVIPNIRWGDERTFTTIELPEKIAFLGVEKHSIVAIGEYGQIKSKEDKRLFRDGLIAMLDELDPEIVIVYGKMSKKIFDGLLHRTKFVFYEDWISLKRGGNAHGNK